MNPVYNLNKDGNIWITGDVHGADGFLLKFDNQSFYEQNQMISEDRNKNFVIICGDAGIIWDFRGKNKKEEYVLDWLSEKPFTILFVDGNHENFDRLYSYPVEKWNGGKVHKIRDNVMHLMRGEYFDICGKTFFTFGGARSHDISDGILDMDKDIEKIHLWSQLNDKMFRINKVSWWEQEMPSKDEFKHGIDILSSHNWKVDFIITHSPSYNMLPYNLHLYYAVDDLMLYFDKLQKDVKYKMWFCGHIHMDGWLNDKDIALYHQIVKIL